ncbi:putative heavy metal-associated domain superfamily [Arabidopsis thaliana]|uniref:HMA domain-containing protein n=2 Tax=Arabidopsis thaliana TaxID=3702 RepID=A0A654FPZ8_ARATH|nr:superoxide dismutase 1 copper chaperone-like protein [Arabidopsis thaliana]ANM66135.1 superoxide dismutase 1 copper chaperone-like protein [Arabidopsis thaliana]CAA0395365.1 unnamed protein product [Arabidopsis thaliana]VYS62803.1 unnamed protein product [Arabidopsis thaliana]|eukprot:NP_001328049.1 superoxide dismutase 1 copper chaperone-like protein [Arabidopsis thaliana]
MGCSISLNQPDTPKDFSHVEFKMPECSICERAMTHTISKFKGVTLCVPDKENQKIKVSGSFNKEKLLKKIMKVIKELEIHDGKNEEKDELIRKKQEETEMAKIMMLNDENANRCTIS